jgi:hypothetical protein
MSSDFLLSFNSISQSTLCLLDLKLSRTLLFILHRQIILFLINTLSIRVFDMTLYSPLTINIICMYVSCVWLYVEVESSLPVLPPYISTYLSVSWSSSMAISRRLHTYDSKGLCSTSYHIYLNTCGLYCHCHLLSEMVISSSNMVGVSV